MRKFKRLLKLSVIVILLISCNNHSGKKINSEKLIDFLQKEDKDYDTRFYVKGVVEFYKDCKVYKPDFRVFLLNRPKYGGFIWQEIPFDEINNAYSKIDLLKYSLLVEMECCIRRHAIEMTTDPETFPEYIFINCTNIKLKKVKKINLVKGSKLPLPW